MKKNGTLLLFILALPSALLGQIVERERPAAWKDLVPGGQFKDLFLPIPVRDGFTSDTWGGDNVKPRDITNGIEDPQWSYWCGYPIRDEKGDYHLFAARWREDHPRGHFGYFDSEIVHATAADPLGPYTYQDTLGEGHNPELYQTQKGKYIVYSTHGRYFRADSLYGPWKRRTYDFHKRDRYVFPNYVNFSFAPRDSGSFMAVSRRGYIWVSPDGEENWYNTSAESVYPKVPGIFEDPVLWKDDIQYHVIVNDWKGRIAYYLRSKDGFHWKTEPGEAYVPGICRYENGKVSDWFKFERIRFLQDEHGRPTHVHFAVTDIAKHDDLSRDNHNSKLIVIPMRVARRLEMLNTEPITSDTREIRIKLLAEDGFDPHQDIQLDSLRYGASDEVNYGRGSRVLRVEKTGNDLLLVFNGQDSGITAENFAGKLLGKDKKGEILFGWSNLPGTVKQVPLLSPLSPRFEYTDHGLEAYVEVENFGELKSPASTLKLLLGDGQSNQVIAAGTVRPLMPFEKAIVRLLCKKSLARGSQHVVTVTVESKDWPAESFTKKVRLART